MLKWTITKRSDCTDFSTRQKNHYHKRRSLGDLRSLCEQPTFVNSTQKLEDPEPSINIQQYLNKENRYVSIPALDLCSKETTSNTLGVALGAPLALRDVSNVTPNTTPKRLFSNTPIMTSTMKKQQRNIHYSSTLPTFDVEYSPCEMRAASFDVVSETKFIPSTRNIPLSVPYKPKITWPEKVENPVETTDGENRNLDNLVFNISNEKSLNSSQMGDTMLDKMIDAILESARKERSDKTLSIIKNGNKKKDQVPLSPTYASADDPANDLFKHSTSYLELSPEKYLQSIDKTIILDETSLNEREIKTPDVKSLTGKRKREDSPESFNLRRHRVVRRKIFRDKMNNILDPKHSKSKITKLIPSPQKPTIENTHFRKPFEDTTLVVETPKSHHHQQYLASQNETKLLERSQSKLSNASTPDMKSTSINATSTPTVNDECFIQKCLTFPNAIVDNPMGSHNSSCSNISIFSKSILVKGLLEISIKFDSQNEKLYIHGELV